MEEKAPMLCFVHSNRLTASGAGELDGAVEFCIKGLSDPEGGDLTYEDTFVRVYVACQFQPHQSAWSVGKEKAKEVLLERLHDLIKKVEEMP